MKKEWKEPVLEVLDVNQTMYGSPNVIVDYDDQDGELVHGPNES